MHLSSRLKATSFTAIPGKCGVHHDVCGWGGGGSSGACATIQLWVMRMIGGVGAAASKPHLPQQHPITIPA